MRFRLPHITGKTPAEQIFQIVNYLRDLAGTLQDMTAQSAPEGVADRTTHNSGGQFLSVPKLKKVILSDTGWVELNPCVSWRSKCGVVTVVGITRGDVELASGSYTTVGTLPEICRPDMEVPFTFHCLGGDTSALSALVLPDGQIQLYATAEWNTYWAFSVTYLT